MLSSDTSKIRKATLEDATEISLLLGQLGYPTDGVSVRRRLEAILSRSDYVVIVAERARGLAGLVGACWGLYLEHDGRWGRITALVVTEACRRQGIGALLIDQAESWLRSQQALTCIVNSRPQRTGAHRFYVSRGYQVTGLRFVKSLTTATQAGCPLQRLKTDLSESRITGAPASTRH
jgi:N-acetylglutamate synthase-like GNAT family acetyltransferase